MAEAPCMCEALKEQNQKLIAEVQRLTLVAEQATATITTLQADNEKLSTENQVLTSLYGELRFLRGDEPYPSQQDLENAMATSNGAQIQHGHLDAHYPIPDQSAMEPGPSNNFVQIVGPTKEWLDLFPEKKRQKLGDECKKCGAKVTNRQSQEVHIAHHLNLTIMCPIPRCARQSTIDIMYRHMRTEHKAPLRAVLADQWDESKRVYQKAVSEAKSSFF